MDFFDESDDEQDVDRFPGNFGDDDDFDEREIENLPEMKAEIGAFERAGLGGRLTTTLVQGGAMGKLHEKAEKELATPEERFEVYVDATCRSLAGDGVFHISQPDIDIMIETVRTVSSDKIKYLNPVAYVLGFLASRGGRGLDSVFITKQIFPQLNQPKISDASIEPADVIRYGRYWMTLAV